MYQSREIDAPELPCPHCRPRRASKTAGEPGRWNHCPDCAGLWREPSGPGDTHAHAVAEERYFKAGRKAVQAYRSLQKRRNTPRDRWIILANLASLSDDMSAAALVWDNDRTDSDGFTPAEWMATEARLLRLVIATERALTLQDDELVDPYRFAALDEDPLGANEQVRAVLAQLSEAADLAERADLTMELHHAVVDAVGGQAAETLASVADCYRKSVQPMWRRFVPWL